MTTQQAPAIRVQGLEKSYKDLKVLPGVDFEVLRGGIFSHATPRQFSDRFGCGFYVEADIISPDILSTFSCNFREAVGLDAM
jgi:hypothetical protein